MSSNRHLTQRFSLLPKLLLALGLSVVLAILSMVVFEHEFIYGVSLRNKKQNYKPTIEDWKTGLENLMNQRHFSRKWISGLENFRTASNGGREELLIRMRYPGGYPIHEFLFNIIAISKENGCKILESYESIKPRGFGLAASTLDHKLINVRFREDRELEWSSGRIAIIIDDFGYRLDTIVERFLKMPFSITLAVIPGTEYAGEVARLAKEAGHEVMIHMPMEPIEGNVENDGYTIFAGMNSDEIERVVDRALESVPGATGINNHMGSRVTMDREVMSLLMECLKKRNLFFVDSITNRKSVAYETALELGLPALKLTTFLDNTQNNASLNEIMQKIYKSLSSEDPAVLIGHDRDETSQVLQAEMTTFAEKGVSFVRVSDLLENP